MVFVKKFNVFSFEDRDLVAEIEEFLGIRIVYGTNIAEGGITTLATYPDGENLKISTTILENPEIPSHYHEETQHIYVCMAGSLDVLIDGKKYNIAKGHACYIPEKVEHTIETEYAVLQCLELPPDDNDFCVVGE